MVIELQVQFTLPSTSNLFSLYRLRERAGRIRFLQRAVWSEVVTVVCCCFADLKSILGVGPRVKDSIEDPFK
jgi:hypothetical protein